MPDERKFRAPATAEALEIIKREIGPDAAILRTRSTIYRDDRGRVVRGVEITAQPGHAVERRLQNNSPTAAETNRPAGGRDIIVGLDMPFHAREHYVRLVQNEVGDELARQLVMAAVRAAQQRNAGRSVRTAASGKVIFPRAEQDEAAVVVDLLRDAIARMMPNAGGIALTPGQPKTVCLVGPPGGGKTTTLAKLAAHFKLRASAQVSIISLDMNRPGAGEQLRKYAEIIAVPLHAAQTVEAAKEAVTACAGSDLVLIDTPGVSLRDSARFARLAALIRAARPNEIHLVLPAVLSTPAQARAAERFAPLGANRLLLTCLDEAAGLGVVLTAIQRIPWHISYIAVGQKVPTDLQEASGTRIAQLLVK
ncbi:MAG: AAA family ATPase [Phycisphaerales bacterium]|nr:AAA family ATPase [Phycisphaerales bacterium]